MLLRILICVVVLVLTQSAAHARRVALVIGQTLEAPRPPSGYQRSPISRVMRPAWRSYCN